MTRTVERDTRRIARELMDEPYITGRRVSVRQVYALVEERGVDPEPVADRYDLDVADVYHALAYYHDHPQEMSDVEAEREAGFDTVGYSRVTDSDTPGYRKSSRSYSRQYEEFRERIERPDGVEPDIA